MASKWKQLIEALSLVGGGTGLFVGYSIYNGNERFYREYIMPCMKIIDPETTHNFALALAKYKLVPKQKVPDPAILQTKVWGKEFLNPVGVAAGFDKDGVAVDGMLKSGFGFVEVGSVTPLPQPGNPKPRLFRLPEDRGVINRFGFNSEGHEKVYDRLKNREEGQPVSGSGLVGVNLGKNKTSESPVQDYVQGVRTFGEVADYLVINVSSPNTPGLREMQGKQVLQELIDKVLEERSKLKRDVKPPVLVKIDPDSTESVRADIAEVILNSAVDGLVVSNTTVSRPSSLQSKHKTETGGLSGEPLKVRSTETVRDMYRLTNGKVPIIGVGGVSNGQDAYDKIRAGASLVQLYSALVYQGPPVVSRVKRELQELLEKDGYTNVSEAVGVDVNTKTKK